MREAARYVTETVASVGNSGRGGYARSECSSGELRRAGADAGSRCHASANCHASTDCHGDANPDGHPLADGDGCASHADVHAGSNRYADGDTHAYTDTDANRDGCAAYAYSHAYAYSGTDSAARAHCAANDNAHYTAHSRTYRTAHAYHAAYGNADTPDSDTYSSPAPKYSNHAAAEKQAPGSVPSNSRAAVGLGWNHQNGEGSHRMAQCDGD